MLSIPMLSKDPSEDVTVRLPKFVFGLGHHFYEHCIDEFTRRIKVCYLVKFICVIKLIWLRGHSKCYVTHFSWKFNPHPPLVTLIMLNRTPL